MGSLYFLNSFPTDRGKTAAESEPTFTVPTETQLAKATVVSTDPNTFPLAQWKTVNAVSEKVDYQFKHPPGWESSGNCFPATGSSVSAPPPGCVQIEVIAGQKARDLGDDLAGGEQLNIGSYSARKFVSTIPSGGSGQKVYTFLAYDAKGESFWGLVTYFSAGTDPDALVLLTRTIDQIVETITLQPKLP